MLAICYIVNAICGVVSIDCKARTPMWLHLQIMSRYDNGNTEDDDDLSNSAGSSKKKKMISVLYYMYTHNLSLSPIHIPSKIRIKQVHLPPNCAPLFVV